MLQVNLGIINYNMRMDIHLDIFLKLHLTLHF